MIVLGAVTFFYVTHTSFVGVACLDCIDGVFWTRKSSVLTLVRKALKGVGTGTDGV